MRATALAAATVIALATGTGVVAGQTAESQPSFALRYAFKSSGLFARAPDWPELYPDRGSAAGYWRLRVEPVLRIGAVTFETAVEPRARVESSAASPLGSFVSEAPAPWRIRQLDWSLGTSEHASWRLEIDRAAIHAQVGAADLVVGRQAIGWGRGVLFGAVDLFSPFSPLEPDREWRRGVDAARADLKLSERTSLDLVAALGEHLDASIYAARFRGYAGNADLELVGGRRARDGFAGVTSSLAVAGAEVHSEVVAFRLPQGATPLLDRTVVKALAGASGRVPIGNGLLIFGEYHYSGFGASSARDALARLADPEIAARYARGDMQVLSRHTIAVLGNYEQSPETAWAFQWLQSPIDGSGVFVPSATLTFSDRTSLVVTGYLPFGRARAGDNLGSDFGATPAALFTQLRIYR